MRNCKTGVVEYEVSMSKTGDASAGNFSQRFFIETVLSLHHKPRFEMTEDQDNTSFACALFAWFIPTCRIACNEPCRQLCLTRKSDYDTGACYHLCSMQASNNNSLRTESGLPLPFLVNWHISANRTTSKFATKWGKGVLLANPVYTSSGNACWESEMFLGPDRYGKETYELNVSTKSLSGNKSVSKQIEILVDAINDPPSFTLPLPTIYVEENQFVTFDYAAAATFRHYPGPFEEYQHVTFNISLISGDGHMFADGPQINPNNGSLTFRLFQWQRGSAVYAVMLKDDGMGSDSSLVQNLTILVHPVNRVPSFTFTLPADLGWGFEESSNINIGNGSLRVPEGFSSSIFLQTFAANIASGTPMDSLEAAQRLSFQIELISGNESIFSEAPRLATNGSLTLRLNQLMYGIVEYNVTLYDDGCKGDSEFITDGCGGNLACDSCASDCLRTSTTLSAYETCLQPCKGFCTCEYNSSISDNDDFRCARHCRRADNVSRCTGENRSSTETMRIVVEPVNDAPDFKLPAPFIEVAENSYAVYGRADVTCSGSCECTQSSGTSSGTIYEGYLNYSSSQHCTWSISATNNDDRIAVSFPFFDTEHGQDYVTINECSKVSASCSNASQLARLSGKVSSRDVFTSSTGYIQVVFSTEANNITRPGFIAVWSIVPQFSTQNDVHVFPNFATNIVSEPGQPLEIQNVHFILSVEEAGVPQIPGLLHEATDSASHGTILMNTCDSPPQCAALALPGQVFSDTSEISISLDGQLSFKLIAFRHGFVKISCALKDDAGMAFGGQDISQPHSFNISVLPVNGLHTSSSFACS